MPTLLHPDDPAFHRMVAAFEGEPGPWLAVNRSLRDAIVSYAVERSPYYRSVVPAAGAFERIPVLTKEILRDRHDDLLAEGVHRDRWAPDATSGSLGPAVGFVRDTAQGHLENVSALRFLRWMHSIPPQATRVWLGSAPEVAPGQRPGRRRRRPRAEATHAVRTQELTSRRLRAEARRWARFPSYFLYGHASVIGWIAEQVERGEVELPAAPLAVVTTADTLTDHGAANVRRILGTPVHSWYGAREVNGFVAGTLPGERRYAFNPFLVYVEVVDERGLPVPVGETGRVLLTDLNNLVMPFIRFDLGDLAMPSSEPSAGGFPLIEHLVGREIELLRFPSGRVLNGITLGRVLFVERDLAQDILWYQCAKTGRNEVELRVVWSREPSQTVRARAAEAVGSLVDPDTEVRVRAMERLGVLPSGKAWILRDETGASVEARSRPGPPGQPARFPRP
jgi:phenylacetate-CoA ligase